jgi:hypothetical protein
MSLLITMYIVHSGTQLSTSESRVQTRSRLLVVGLSSVVARKCRIRILRFDVNMWNVDCQWSVSGTRMSDCVRLLFGSLCPEKFKHSY